MGETSLLVFSICIQAAIGIILFAFVAQIVYKGKQFKVAAVTAAVLAVVGVFASFAHLGHPLSALNVLGEFGQSWLSTEAVLAGVFAGVAVLYAAIHFLRPDDHTLSLGLSGIGSVLGLVAVLSMAKVYTTTSVPVWQGSNTFVDFYATTVAIGALGFLVTSVSQLQDVSKKLFGYSILVAVVIQAASTVPHILGLSEMGAAAHSSIQILNGMNTLVWAKWLLILGGAGIALYPASAKVQEGAKLNVNAFVTAGAALVIGQVIGRYLFYATLVVTNVGLM
ncbi:MAG: DmsC/YnfH family molybdoenzyme membrane anchor subunit [Bacillota bacterium]